MIKDYIKKIKNNELQINILTNFIFKGLGIGLNFLSIPIMLKYLDKNNYGLWILILSITNWVYTFDVGIGNGLKNRLAETLSKRNKEEAKVYIATSYFFITIISGILLLIFWILLKNINLCVLFNITFLDREELNKIIFINITFVCINFVLSLCNNIFLGAQKSYLSSINNVLGQSLNFILILSLFYIKKNSIILLSFSYGSGIMLSHFCITYYYFYKNKDLLFKLNNITLNKGKDILGVGLKIFLVQVTGLIIFSTDNLIITRYSGIQNVAVYNVVNKFFGIPILILMLITTPIWPAVTKAFHQKNKDWIAKTLKKLEKIFLMLVILTIGLIFIAKPVIRVWTIDEINPSIYLIIVCGIATILTCFSNIYSTIIFAIDIKWYLLILFVLQAIINIVVSLAAIKYFDLGVIGVVLGTCFSMLTNVFVLPKSLRCLLKNT